MTDSLGNQNAIPAECDNDAPEGEDSTPSKNRDPSPFARLYKDYLGELISGLRATYGDGPPDPDDVAQQAFANLRARRNLDDIKDPKGFVWFTARNIVMSEKRALRVRSDHAQEVHDGLFWGASCDEFDPERVFSAREELDIIMKTIADLPERRRRIFLANRVDGLTPEAAGRTCGVSRSSAVRHIALASSAIAEALTHENSANAAVVETK